PSTMVVVPFTFSILFFHGPRPPRDLHSFPTRRSSDLHMGDLLLARGDHGGQIGGHALGPQRVGQISEGLDVDVVGVDVMTGVAVDLQIDQTRLGTELPVHRPRPPERSSSGSWAAAASSRWTTTS